MRKHQGVIKKTGKATYSIEEGADLLGIGRNTAYEAARRGEIKTIRIGGRLLIPGAWLDRLVKGAGDV